jgi:SAM-dependent methyltransferase
MKLNLGAGPSGQGDKRVDIVPYPGVTDILDVAVESLPYPDNTFDEVEASQLLEHIPNVIYYPAPEGGKLTRRYCRIELMREIHRVLKPGGRLIASVPTAWPEWAQDPTHTGVPWNREQFSYFCGMWGGNKPGDFAHDSYGITFEFKMLRGDYEGAHLLVELEKVV